ncbi:E3 ubiquitin-protein ligase RNF13 [Trichoplax sp. H2]|nr:E3 ubiquitin-protein ligase RNF13 [Trichoplax sp. H2]|eukprot:RDD38802.1 E3 ubiquitin-protein ligase RNF13 [Trichoplax sp. H2]
MSVLMVKYYLASTVALILLLHKVNGELYATTATNVTFVFPSLEAKFGPRLPMNGLRGIINTANPIDACSTIRPPPYNSSKLNWFVVIRRGGCDFSVKVYTAQQAGYAAAIVYNNGGSNEITRMEGGPDFAVVQIPSIFVGEETGFALRESFFYATGATIVLARTFPSLWTFYCLPFVMIGVICILMLLGLAISGLHMMVQKHRDRNRLRRRVDSLPTKKFKKGRDDQIYDVCAVCLEDYEDNDKLRLLPCNHAFHARCIDPWILGQDKSTCPLCKQPINKKAEQTDCECNRTEEETEPNQYAASAITNHEGAEAALGATGTSESTPLMLYNLQPELTLSDSPK